VEYSLAARGKRRWHETKLDEGAHIDRQQKIDDLVTLKKE
jgi:hypothetical protein